MNTLRTSPLGPRRRRRSSGLLPLVGWVIAITVSLACGGPPPGPGLAATIERFRDPEGSAGTARVTFQLRVETTEDTEIAVPYLLEVAIDGQVAAYAEVLVGVEGPVDDPEAAYWQVDGERGGNVTEPELPVLEALGSEVVSIVASGARIGKMLSEIERNRQRARETVDSLLLERGKWEIEVASLDDRLARSEIGLVELGEIGTRVTAKIEELGARLNVAIPEFKKWGRWQTGVVHKDEVTEFDGFARRYVVLSIATK